MKKISILSILLIVMTFITHSVHATTPPIVGDDVDAHGCKPSAGYSWDEKTQKCIRPWENQENDNNCRMPTRDLRFGDGERNNKHGEVKDLQENLMKLGYLRITSATGYFGSMTQKALIKYQRENKINATGYMGQITRSAMKNHICKGEKPSSGENSASCKVWFDGCNTCSRSSVGGPMACTMMACVTGGDTEYWQNSKPYCKEYFKD